MGVVRGQQKHVTCTIPECVLVDGLNAGPGNNIDQFKKVMLMRRLWTFVELLDNDLERLVQVFFHMSIIYCKKENLYRKSKSISVQICIVKQKLLNHESNIFNRDQRTADY